MLLSSAAALSGFAAAPPTPNGHWCRSRNAAEAASGVAIWGVALHFALAASKARVAAARPHLQVSTLLIRGERSRFLPLRRTHVSALAPIRFCAAQDATNTVQSECVHVHFCVARLCAAYAVLDAASAFRFRASPAIANPPHGCFTPTREHHRNPTQNVELQCSVTSGHVRSMHAFGPDTERGGHAALAARVCAQKPDLGTLPQAAPWA
eukprot:4690412-Prymnesium_polylepis.1